jgi:alpha-aminoadipate/glutamate carrier protein LysW
MTITTVDETLQSEIPECPECEAPIETRPTMTGELVDCATCGVELEAVSLAPLRFETAPEVEEDWGE